MSMKEQSEKIRAAHLQEGSHPINRSAFLYMDPRIDQYEGFGQCGTCRMFLPGIGRCSLHGRDVPVSGFNSCGLYVPGEQAASEVEHMHANVSPAESGLTKGPVTCQNCTFYRAENLQCGLYTLLNAQFPNVFDLDEEVHPKGCCNAMEPRL